MIDKHIQLTIKFNLCFPPSSNFIIIPLILHVANAIRQALRFIIYHVFDEKISTRLIFVTYFVIDYLLLQSFPQIIRTQGPRILSGRYSINREKSKFQVPSEHNLQDKPYEVICMASRSMAVLVQTYIPSVDGAAIRYDYSTAPT